MSPKAVEYNPFSCEIHEDLYPTDARLRERAPAYYDEEHDPDTFDNERKIERILSFGHGPHRCAGSARRRDSRA